MLQQYSGGATPPPEEVNRHFDTVSTQAPSSMLGQGLAEAFRSDRTPPFAQMLSGMFGRTSGSQRAGLLNMLLAAAGPAILGKIMQGRGGGGGLGSILGGGRAEVTPEQADAIPEDVVRELAENAEKKDPTIVDQVSQFYAEHPTLVKTIGAAGLAILMANLSQRNRAG